VFATRLPKLTRRMQQSTYLGVKKAPREISNSFGYLQALGVENDTLVNGGVQKISDKITVTKMKQNRTNHIFEK